MGRRPYRVEINYPVSGPPKYFLVKDIRVGNKKQKIKKYLCSGDPPNQEQVEEFRKQYSYEIEYKAALKKAELSSSRYILGYLKAESIENLEKIRFLYQTVSSLMTTDELKFYKENFEVTYIHGTTSIEGNTLTLDQAKSLIQDKIAPKGKELREINEVQNFKDVIKYRDSYKGKISLQFIKKLHSLIMKNIDDDGAGLFRNIDTVFITGSDIIVTPHMEIENELQKIIDYYYKRLSEGYHPFEEAVMFHYFFEIIHPFKDGNGRVGREIFNYILAKAEYPRLLFLGETRDYYIGALKDGNQDEFNVMVEKFVNLLVKQRFIILQKNLKTIVLRDTITHKGQMKLDSFFET